MNPIRKSVPTSNLQSWLNRGWVYIRPDFDAANHSLIEWQAVDIPTYPRVSYETVATPKTDK